MSNAISLKNVSKSYKIPSIFPWKRSKIINALEDVGFTCPGEKITCLLGPNGAGKTTIIKILAGLVIPDSGKVEIFHKPFFSSKKINGPRIGLVTQNERSFYWRLTGRQNLDFFASLYNLNKKEKNQKIDEVLSIISMESEADKPFRLYSAGMKQKLHIARALLYDPDILLLDEPTTHIDPIAQVSIHNLIKNEILKKRKTTVLLCTHNLNEAQILSDKIILLNNGQILASGNISSLRSMINPNITVIMEFSKMPKKGWGKYIAAHLIKKDNLSIQFNVKNSKTIPKLIAAANAHGGEIIECRKIEESILEIFTRVTQGNR